MFIVPKINNNKCQISKMLKLLKSGYSIAGRGDLVTVGEDPCPSVEFLQTFLVLVIDLYGGLEYHVPWIDREDGAYRRKVASQVRLQCSDERISLPSRSVRFQNKGDRFENFQLF